MRETLADVVFAVGWSVVLLSHHIRGRLVLTLPHHTYWPWDSLRYGIAMLGRPIWGEG